MKTRGRVDECFSEILDLYNAHVEPLSSGVLRSCRHSQVSTRGSPCIFVMGHWQFIVSMSTMQTSDHIPMGARHGASVPYLWQMRSTPWGEVRLSGFEIIGTAVRCSVALGLTMAPPLLSQSMQGGASLSGLTTTQTTLFDAGRKSFLRSKGSPTVSAPPTKVPAATVATTSPPSIKRVWHIEPGHADEPGVV